MHTGRVSLRQVSSAERVALLLGLGLPTVTYAAALLWMVTGLSIPTVVVALGTVAPLTVGLPLYVHAWRKRQRRLADHDLRVCLRCQQSLRGLADKGTCPECGAPYVISAVQWAWQRTYPALGRRRRAAIRPAAEEAIGRTVVLD